MADVPRDRGTRSHARRERAGKKKAAMKADEKIPSVVDVREKVRAFLSLLDAGEAGCSTWWEAIVDTGQDVRAMLDKVLPPRRGEAE